MSIFITGATGYLGSYITAVLLKEYDDRVILLVRSNSIDEAQRKLWNSLQPHMDFSEFINYLDTRIDIVSGNISKEKLGLGNNYESCIHKTNSIIHCASILNRRSHKACFKVNLKGTLEVIRFAQAIIAHHPLKRFSYISTVNVAGIRKNDLVYEDRSIDWERGDYDPYSRTKKFCEHMIMQLLPDASVVIFRPSAIIGDSQTSRTTQFDMVKPFVSLSNLPIIPFNAQWKLDIIPADYTAQAIVTIHQREKPKYSIYHISSGTHSLTYREIVKAAKKGKLFTIALFAPFLEKPCTWIINLLSRLPKKTGLSRLATHLNVFMPYITYNTVFDNSRVREETGMAPVSFKKYCRNLFDFSQSSNFKYPYKPWPEKSR